MGGGYFGDTEAQSRVFQERRNTLQFQMLLRVSNERKRKMPIGFIAGATWMKAWERSTDRSDVRPEWRTSESGNTGNLSKALKRRENTATIKRDIES